MSSLRSLNKCLFLILSLYALTALVIYFYQVIFYPLPEKTIELGYRIKDIGIDLINEKYQVYVTDDNGEKKNILDEFPIKPEIMELYEDICLISIKDNSKKYAVSMYTYLINKNSGKISLLVVKEDSSSESEIVKHLDIGNFYK